MVSLYAIRNGNGRSRQLGKPLRSVKFSKRACRPLPPQPSGGAGEGMATFTVRPWKLRLQESQATCPIAQGLCMGQVPVQPLPLAVSLLPGPGPSLFFPIQ